MEISEFFTTSAIEKIIRRFRRVTNGEPQATPEQCKKICHKLGVFPTDAELAEMFPAEAYTIPEFILPFFYFARGADSKEELLRVFQLFTTDDSVEIPRATAETILRKMNHSINKKRVDKIFAACKGSQEETINIEKLSDVLSHLKTV